MKFPRTAKIMGSKSEAAAYASVFFVLVILILIAALLPTPGIKLSLVDLPVADNLSGANQPLITVAIDCSNRLYFANQMIDAAKLRISLSNSVISAPSPLTLVIQADKSVSYDKVLQLSLMARDAGITNALLATMPRADDAPLSP